MNRSLNINFLGVFLFLLCTSCSSEVKEQKIPSLNEFKNYGELANWSIYPSDGSRIAFKKQFDTDDKPDTESFFLVRKRAGEIFILDVLEDNNNYTSYDNLSTPSKNRVDYNIIEIYFDLGFREILYRESNKNSYLLFKSDSKSYWYFFEYDSLNPPVFSNNMVKVEGNLFEQSN